MFNQLISQFQRLMDCLKCLPMKIMQTLLLVLFTVLPHYMYGQESQEVMKISLEDVRSVAEAESPYYKEMAEEKEAVSKEIDTGLQRNNPSLNYDLEFLGDGNINEWEQFFFVEQTFERPGLYSSRETSASHQKASLEHALDDEGRSFFTSVRADYMNLILLEHNIEVQETFIDHIEQLAEVARSQAEAGELSPLEQQLIDLSHLSISGELADLKADYQNKLSEWKERMGIAPDTPVELTSEPPLTDISMPDLPEIHEESAAHPALMAAEFHTRAANESIRSAELRRFPEFDVSAGYKRMNPNLNGFLVGVSIPLPIINRNQAEIEQRSAERRQADLIREQQEQRLQIQWQRQWETLNIYYSELKEARAGTLDIKQLGRRIENGFVEGTISLTDALNSFETGANGYRSYISAMKNFYEALAEMEYLTDHNYIEAH